ncbi:MAG: glycine--tRNA ligase [Bacilli bacterium]|jgi:glycyl-tRNA synthetase|nr:glycine--tRNA ligase [Bacilli bacterium]
MHKLTMEKMVGLCKQYGFIFQGSEIYGGLSNTFDYGPLGVELKNNIKKAWYKKFVQESKYNVGLDSAILMNSKVWEASGHIVNFNDPLIDCKNCKMRYRADKLIEDFTNGEVISDGWDNQKMIDYIKEHNITCSNCKKLDYTDIRKFNMMFKTHQGVIEDESNAVYLRPETAQGMFVNFLNVQRSMRLKIPFGIAQMGKSFRNEITPGNFIFRTREFEQMELEFFCKPGTELGWFDYWKTFSYDFLISLGIKKENIRLREHSEEELSHYSNATVDIEYKFPFGFSELWGIASRTDFDLKAHMEHSKENLTYLDPNTNERYIPYVIEPALGVDRLVLTILCDSYERENLDNGEIREILHLHPALAPYKLAVLPLQKKQHRDKANELYQTLTKHFMTTYDEIGSIGKRYRRQDVIGTPFCITIDNDTLANQTVTVRNRDTMAQETIKIDDVITYINKRIVF